MKTAIAAVLSLLAIASVCWVAVEVHAVSRSMDTANCVAIAKVVSPGTTQGWGQARANAEDSVTAC